MSRPVTIFLTLAISVYGTQIAAHAQDAPGPLYASGEVRGDAASRREARKQPAIRVDIEDGAYAFDVLGTLAVPPHLEQRTWSFAVDFGAEYAAPCKIHAGQLAEMGRLSVFAFEHDARKLLDALEAENLLRYRLAHYKTRVEDDRPVLETDWRYYAPKGRVEAYGVTKVRLAYVEGSTLVCSHNMPGYNASFSRLFNRMVDSMVVGRPPVDPHYQAFFQIYHRGERAGFRTLQMRKDASGETQTIVYETRHLALGYWNDVLYDDMTTEHTTADGRVVSSYTTLMENGFVHTYAALEDNGQGWTLTGKLDNTRLSRAFRRAGQPFVSQRGLLLARQDLMTRPRGEPVDYDLWLPSVDPTDAITASLGVRKTGDRSFRYIESLIVGPYSRKATLREDGTMRSATVTVGSLAFDYRSVFHEGAIE